MSIQQLNQLTKLADTEGKRTPDIARLHPDDTIDSITVKLSEDHHS